MSNEYKVGHLCQKPTDTGIILNFCRFVTLEDKKLVIRGTVHRVFNATSNWLAFDQVLEKKQDTLDQKSIFTRMSYKSSEPDLRKDNNWQLRSIENNTKTSSISQTGSKDPQ